MNIMKAMETLNLKELKVGWQKTGWVLLFQIGLKYRYVVFCGMRKGGLKKW